MSTFLFVVSFVTVLAARLLSHPEFREAVSRESLFLLRCVATGVALGVLAAAVFTLLAG